MRKDRGAEEQEEGEKGAKREEKKKRAFYFLQRITGKVNLGRASYRASIELIACGFHTEKGVCSCNHPLQNAWSVDSSPQSPPSGCLAFALRTWSLPLLNTPSSCCKGDDSVGTGFCFCFCFLAREWPLSFSALARSVAREAGKCV